MAPSAPSKKFLAKGLMRQGTTHYVAQFAAPGMTPAILTDEKGREREFAVEQEAEVQAMYALLEAMNEPRTLERLSAWGRLRVEKWGGPDLTAAMRSVGIEPEVLADLYGTRVPRVLEWMAGKQDIPHPVRVLLSIFRQHPETVATAISVTRGAGQAGNAPGSLR